MKTMGELIAEKRKGQGMSQAELAAKMNVTDKAVSKWERGLSCPDVNSLASLAEAIDVSVNELLTAKTETAQPKDYQKVSEDILLALSLAMGVAVSVLAALKGIDPESALIMLGFGLAAISIVTFNDRKKK